MPSSRTKRNHHKSSPDPTKDESKQALRSLAARARALADSIERDAFHRLPAQIAEVKASASEFLSNGDLDHLSNDAKRRLEMAVADLPHQLETFCRENGLELRGAFPDFVVNGLIYVGIKSDVANATINDEIVPLFPLPTVFEAVLGEMDRMRREKFDAPKFCAALEAAHRNCLLRREQSALQADRVSVFELLGELAFRKQPMTFVSNPVREKFRSYSQHQFRADLFRLVSSDTELIKHRRLVLEPTSVAENGLFMYLPALGRCSFIGHVVINSNS